MINKLERKLGTRNETASSTSEKWKAVGNIDCVVGVRKMKERGIRQALWYPLRSLIPLKRRNSSTSLKEQDVVQGY